MTLSYNTVESLASLNQQDSLVSLRCLHSFINEEYYRLLIFHLSPLIRRILLGRFYQNFNIFDIYS